MVVHWKIQFLKGGSGKKIYIEELLKMECGLDSLKS